MKKTLMVLLALSSLLAGCIVVPVGHPWHHDHDRWELEQRGYGSGHDEGWRR